MEATASIVPAAFATHPTNPFVQKHKVIFPRQVLHSIHTRAASASDSSTKSIRLTIQAEDPSSKSDPAKLVIEVPQQEQQSHDSVTEIASESAVESPDKVHEQAREEAKSLAVSDQDVEEVSRNLEKEAEKVSEQQADGGLDRETDKMGTEARDLAGDEVGKKAGDVGSKARDLVPQADEAIQAADEVREVAKEEGLDELKKNVEEVLKGSKAGVQKRVQVFAEAAEDASQKGNRVVEAAKKGFEGIKTQLSGVQKNVGEIQKKVEEQVKSSGVQEGVTKAVGDVQKNVGEIQKKVEEQVKASGVQEGVTKVAGDVQKNVGEIQKKVEEQLKKGQEKGEFYDKHRAVDVEDVNKDGEQTLSKQREMEGDDVEKVTSELREEHPEVESTVNKRQAELQSEVDKKREQGSYDKHRAVDSEDVNKDGEKKLAEQRAEGQSEMEKGEESAVTEAIREHVDPVLGKMREELDSEVVVGDGTEHLKNMNDLVLHDAYAPVEDSDEQ